METMGEMFEHMMVFAKVVETGSITKAAEQLKITKSSVSKRLSDLESALGVKLMQRTTRRSHLTEAGELYLRKSQMILEEVRTLIAALCIGIRENGMIIIVALPKIL